MKIVLSHSERSIMEKTKITVLSSTKWISVFFSVRPFVYTDKKNVKIHFTNSIDYCFQKDTNKIIILVGKISSKDDLPTLIGKFRLKYSKIIYFHDKSKPTINIDIIKLVDKYLIRNAYKDRSLYLGLNGNKNIFHEYCFNKINNENSGFINDVQLNQSDLNKLNVAWSLGIGVYPSKKYITNLAIRMIKWFDFWVIPIKTISFGKYPNVKKKDLINSMMSLHNNKKADFQRTYIFNEFKNDRRFLFEKVSLRRYNKLIAISKITISPFGYGEVCFRDYEAILAKSLLIKPDMSHIETWPDVYVPFVTYVPVKWDLSDLKDKINYYLYHEEERNKIVDFAFNHLIHQRAQIKNRAKEIIDFIIEP